MKSFTTCASVANKFFKVLQGYTKGIQFLLVIFLTLTVSANVWGATWEKATSIAAGDVVLLVCESKNMELSSISTTSTKYGIGVAYTTSPAGAYELTVEAGSSSGTYSLKNNGKYLYWGSGNSLATNTTKSANTSWSITFSNGNATIKNANDKSRIIGWNASSPRFACYTSSQTAVQLYKKVTAVQTVAVTGVSLNITSLTLTEGSSETLTASVSPDNATDKTITWTTNNSSVATVSSGKVTAVAAGNATITVTTTDGGKTATCNVTVNPKPKYTVTLVPGSGSVTDTELEEPNAGDGVTLPRPTLSSACQLEGWSFAGWAEASVATEAEDAPTILYEADYTYKPTSNITLYAIYKRTEEGEGGGSTPTEVSKTYTFSEYEVGTQYAEETYELDDDVTIKITGCHINTQLRVYGGQPGIVISEVLPGRIVSMGFNMGYKADKLVVSGSTDGTSWNEVGSISTTTSYKDYTLDFWETNYTYFKLNVEGSSQIRIAKMSITYESTSGGGSSSTTYYHSTPECTTETSVTLQPNGGTGTAKVLETTDGSLTLPECDFTYEGYRFVGWNTKANGTGATYQPTAKYTPTENPATLYAKWAKEYTVTYNANDGTTTCEDNNKYIAGEQVTVCASTPTRDSYTFNGWSYSPSVAITDGQFSMPANDVTITAQWTSNKTTTSLTWSEDAYSATIDVDNDFPTLTISPYDLTGIIYSSSDETIATIDANTGEITLKEDGTTTITATFTETATHTGATASYTLTVHPSNCRWVETEIGEIQSGDEVVITMTKENYVWTILNEKQTSSTAPTTVDISANVEGKYLTTVNDGNKWVIEKNNDNLTFYSYTDQDNHLYCINDDNGVRVGTGDAKVFVVDGNYLKNTQTTSPRYIGVSLNTDPYSWRCYTVTTGVIKAQTLKLYKKECLPANEYWVTWDAGEGTWEEKSSKKIESYQVGTTITAPTENPTREGYRFDGWTPAPTTMPAQNTTFTAVWTKVYTITWYENGVPSYTYVPSDNAVVTWDDNIADCGEKKFYGWTADDKFVSDPTTPPTCITKGITINGDATYYAVYADAVEPANSGYVKVTTISEGTYLIATDNTANKAYTGRSGTNTYGGYCAVEIVDNVIKEPESAVEVKVTLTGSNFYMHDGTYYLGYTSGNAMTFDASIQTGNQNIWKLTTDEGYIESINVSGRILQYNSGSPRFACYTSNQKKAYLYKKQTTTYANFAVSCNKYTITITPPTGGTVTTTPADEAGQGQTITVNVTPADCKYLTALNYNDGSDHAISIANTPYTFVMPATDVTVTATFADKTATNIEVVTSAHRMLMQGSAFVGEQVRITYNNGDKETLNWNDSRLTFTGHNTATLGSQTVTVTYNDCGTQSASYNIEVIDGLGITFWDGDYTETIKYEPGDLVDVDNRIGQNICSGWEFAGWSETKVANESKGFTPVHNFNATDAKVLYAVYVETSTDWISAYNINDLHSGAKYVIVAHYSSDNEYALTNTSTTNASYLDGAKLTTVCEQVREGDAYPYKDRYKLKVTPQPSWKWQLVNTGSGWTMRNISANKYLKVNGDKTISLTTTADDKFTLSNGYNDSEITAQSSSNYYLSWYNSSKYWNGHTSGQQYYLTNETNFTSTPPCSPLSATFHGNGGIVTDGVNSGDDLTITEPTRDAGITTPTASFTDCNGKSWTFVGWSREEIDVTGVPVLTTDLLHDGGGNKHYDIQEDSEEFWAVFTNIGNPETKYGTITFTDADVTKQYENAKTITKSVTAMGDYDFELYHVSNASSLGIQFDHNNATKGYIKNITSLGKINSISLNDFQTGDINEVKVYVGNMPNAINTLLTEADLQQTGNTYTYYPQKNYAYVKIEANGYCGITSISIDFGKGTQIWATTPDCSTITLFGDELYVTSTNGQSIRAAERLTVKAVQLESKAKVVISSNSSDIYFSDVQDANFTQAVKPTETLTLTTDVDGNLAATEIYVHYRPSVDGTGIPEDVVVSANLETPNPGITDDHTIHVRNLPADFVIAAKWGDNWYALPANMDSQSSTEGLLIEVDDAANPTKAIAAPNTTKYGVKSVYTSNSTDDRFAANGERLVFVENVTEATPVANKTLYNGGDASSSKTNIQVYAQYSGYYNTNPDRYEWIPTTTNLMDYTLTSGAILTDDKQGRTISLDNHGVFGTLLQNKSYNGMVRLLPVESFYTPTELQVVEWKANSVSIMYTGAGTKATTKVGNSESAVQLLSDKKIKIDHAVYTLATSNLTAATNQVLTISIKDDAENTIGTLKLTIPWIVSDSESSTSRVASEVAQATDIVVLDGATLTADDTKYTYNDVVVYPGGKLVIGTSGKLGMYSLTLRLGSSWGAAEYEHKYPEFVLNTKADGAYSNTSGKINLDYVTTKSQYYTFVAPFEVKTKDIKYPVDIYGSNVEAANRGSFEFQYYDGEARANGEKGWKVVAEDPTNGATLTAHQGYTFYGMPKKVNGTRQTFGIHRIPMAVAAGTVMDHENSEQNTAVSAYPSQHNINAGWNLIGNPYMSTISGLDNTSIQTGTIVLVDNRWQWSNEADQYNQRFIVFPSNDGEWYDTSQATNAELPAFKNFFVQIGKEVNTLSIPRNIPQAQLLAPIRHTDEEVEHDIEMAIVLEKDEAHSDQMDFLLNDAYGAGFDHNADFTKMMNNTNLNLYGVHWDDKLSFVAIDHFTARAAVEIGYQVPSAGEYTLRISDKPYVMLDKIEALYVTDHEMNPAVTTNLMEEDYVFHVGKAEINDTRFTISLSAKANNDGDDVTTDMGEVDIHNDLPQKFFYDGKLYILREGKVYSATGHEIKTINK